MYLTIFGNPRPWSNTVTDRGPSCWIFLVLIKSSFYTFTSKHYSVSFYHWWFENDIYIMKTKKIQDWKWDSDYGIWPYWRLKICKQVWWARCTQTFEKIWRLNCLCCGGPRWSRERWWSMSHCQTSCSLWRMTTVYGKMDPKLLIFRFICFYLFNKKKFVKSKILTIPIGYA